jgi:hypothetical protein
MSGPLTPLHLRLLLDAASRLAAAAGAELTYALVWPRRAERAKGVRG